MKTSYNSSNRPLFHFRLGTWNVWSLSDGVLDIKQTMFSQIPPAMLQPLLVDACCVNDLVVRTQVHAFLIDTSMEVVLIDTGCGKECGATAGFLTESLHKAGYTRDDISHILLTHLHRDHIGGLLTNDNTKNFRNATVHVPSPDFHYWGNAHLEAQAKESLRPTFATVRKVFSLYTPKLFHPGDPILPGIVSLEAYGHTPGHTAFLCTTDNSSLLLWGDIVHSETIQFTHPTWEIAFDTDSRQAALTRERFLALATDQHLLVGGAHLAGIGIGHVLRQEEHFTWKAAQ